ncbi:hypothetical protein OTU49_000501, partial [Cherax quadricarinatus]
MYNWGNHYTVTNKQHYTTRSFISHSGVWPFQLFHTLLSNVHQQAVQISLHPQKQGVICTEILQQRRRRQTHRNTDRETKKKKHKFHNSVFYFIFYKSSDVDITPTTRGPSYL